MSLVHKNISLTLWDADKKNNNEAYGFAKITSFTKRISYTLCIWFTRPKSHLILILLMIHEVLLWIHFLLFSSRCIPNSKWLPCIVKNSRHTSIYSFFFLRKFCSNINHETVLYHSFFHGRCNLLQARHFRTHDSVNKCSLLFYI